jgi:hypothetical protein
MGRSSRPKTVEETEQTFQPSSAGLSRRSRLENLTVINVIPDGRQADRESRSRLR